MEDDELSSRPTIGFPLGLAFLLIMLICMSGFFICCLNWDRIKSLLLLYRTNSTYDRDIESHIEGIIPLPHQIVSSPTLKEKEREVSKGVAVLMPGDQVPKFIAMSCPCQPPVIPSFTIQLQEPTKFATSARV